MKTDDIHAMASEMVAQAGLRLVRHNDVMECYFAHIKSPTERADMPSVPVFFASTVTPASVSRRITRGVAAMQLMMAA